MIQLNKSLPHTDIMKLPSVALFEYVPVNYVVIFPHKLVEPDNKESHIERAISVLVYIPRCDTHKSF